MGNSLIDVSAYAQWYKCWCFDTPKATLFLRCLACNDLVQVWYTWYICGTPGTGVGHLVQVWYTWYRCGTPDTGVVHLVQVWYTWYRCGTPGTGVVHVVQVWYT